MYYLFLYGLGGLNSYKMITNVHNLYPKPSKKEMESWLDEEIFHAKKSRKSFQKGIRKHKRNRVGTQRGGVQL